MYIKTTKITKKFTENLDFQENLWYNTLEQ